MFRKILIGVVLALSPLSFADEDFGIHGGINLMNVSTSPSSSTDTALGFVLGGNFNLEVSDYLSFEPNIQVTRRGYQFDALGATITPSFYYLEFPFFVKFAVPVGKVSPWIATGPNFGIKLGQSCTTSNASVICSLSESSSTNFGLDFGAGVDLEGTSGTFVLAARYHLGISDVTPNVTQDVKNRGLMVILGYRFGVDLDEE